MPPASPPPPDRNHAPPSLRRRLPAWAGGLAARILGVVLLLAAFAKALDPGLFALDLADLLPLPPATAPAAAAAVIAFEAALGAALLVGSRSRGVLLASNATFAGFVGVVAWQLLRGETAANCGCFGQLVQRTPGQALVEDLVFAALSGAAWLGGARAGARLPWRSVLLATGSAVVLAACAPRLPLDDHVTALSPGVAVADTRLDAVVPELRDGRHLVVLLDRADPEAAATIAVLNERLRLPGGATPVWGVAADDPQLALAFLWTAGPAFEVRSAPARMLRTLHRTLPRSALVDGGRVVATWSGLPAEPALEALARGDLP